MNCYHALKFTKTDLEKGKFTLKAQIDKIKSNKILVLQFNQCVSYNVCYILA